MQLGITPAVQQRGYVTVVREQRADDRDQLLARLAGERRGEVRARGTRGGSSWCGCSTRSGYVEDREALRRHRRSGVAGEIRCAAATALPVDRTHQCLLMSASIGRRADWLLGSELLEMPRLESVHQHDWRTVMDAVSSCSWAG